MSKFLQVWNKDNSAVYPLPASAVLKIEGVLEGEFAVDAQVRSESGNAVYCYRLSWGLTREEAASCLKSVGMMLHRLEESHGQFFAADGGVYNEVEPVTL